MNILAHSMGGLDGRHLLTHILPSDPAYQVRSLTTLSTPHRGSEFMAWCRANIGLGAAMDTEIAQAAVDATLQRAQQTPPPLPSLPWSLKEPLLSHRRPDEEAKKEVAAAASKFPGLDYSLGASLSSYLLKLIDSPAYANLTPDFLHRVFNPSTPDVDGTLYFSAAARIAKLGMWHPLWLPKTILDGAERNLIASGQLPDDPAMRGNDGLVNVDSAKWGTFLGVVEGCDHWQMRGAASFRSGAALSRSSMDGAKSAVGGGEKAASSSSRWGWEDVNTLVGGWLVKRDGGEAEHGRTNGSGLNKLASWIVDRIPRSSPSTSDATPAAKPAPPVLHRSDRRADVFDLERLYVAICRRLYDEGL